MTKHGITNWKTFENELKKKVIMPKGFFLT